MPKSKTSEQTRLVLDELVARCTFPAAGTAVDCAFSGGPDSTALIALAVHHGLPVTAHHVDHGIRAASAADALIARQLAATVGASFRLHRVGVPPGPNLEARARRARLDALPPDAMTGHTADDQAETVFLRLLRGSGDGLAAMQPGRRHPLLALRRADTEHVCRDLCLAPVRDESNESPAMWRNRVRHELLPLAADIAQRDVVPIVARSADLVRDDVELLDQLAAGLDPTDAVAISAAPRALARRALRRWLALDGYPPDAAAVERVLEVARGDRVACEIAPGRRVERSRQHLRIVPMPR